MSKEITIIVSDEDYQAAMNHIANNRPGKPLVAVEMVRAVEGDEGYNLGPFETTDIRIEKAGKISDKISVGGKQVGVILAIGDRDYLVTDPGGNELMRTTNKELAVKWAEGKITLLKKTAPWA